MGLGTDDEILAFAQRWGVLLICKHALPATHSPHPWPAHQDPSGFFGEINGTEPAGESRGCRPLKLSPTKYLEPAT
jgi:hypothetical protein